MRRILPYVLFFYFLFFGVDVFSQNSLKGRVIDKDTREAIGFVNVFLPEQNKGTLTDENGKYSFKNIPLSKIKLQFSSLGYKTEVFTIDKDTVLNVELSTVALQTEEVVVTSGISTTQHDNAIKIELIKAKDISNLGTPNFIEAISSVPGVDMISKGAGVSKPVIRGLSMTNILLLNNGVKMENFQFSENHPFIIDEFGVDRIEVIKGPASLLYGSDAVGGVINIINEKPAPRGKIIGDFSSQYHSNTNGYVSNVGVKGSSQNLNWGFRTGYKNHADYFSGDGNFVPNTRFNEVSYKANLGFNKQFGSFKLFYNYNKPKLGMCVGEAVNQLDKAGRKNDIWFQDLTNQIILSKNKLFLGNYKIDINTSYQINNRKLQTDSLAPMFQMVDMDLKTFLYEVKTYLPSNKDSEYIIGLQGGNKINKNNESPIHVIPNAVVNDLSVFGLYQHTFFASLKFQAGLRYDYRNIITDKEGTKEAVDRKFENLSYSFGATYNIEDRFLFRANIASAYRTPNIAELTTNGMHGNRFEKGNSSLQAQKSYEGDISMHYHTKRIIFDISSFYNTINKYIYMSPSSDTLNNGTIIYKYSQTDSKLYGGEFDFNLLITKQLKARATYSYVEAKRADGSYLPFIPQNKIKLNFNFSIKEYKIFKQSVLKIGVLLASKQNKPAQFETETDGYQLLNIGLGTSVKWNKHDVLLGVYCNNVLNTLYIDHLSTLKDIGYYNMGRNISFKVQIPFGI